MRLLDYWRRQSDLAALSDMIVPGVVHMGNHQWLHFTRILIRMIPPPSRRRITSGWRFSRRSMMIGRHQFLIPSRPYLHRSKKGKKSQSKEKEKEEFSINHLARLISPPVNGSHLALFAGVNSVGALTPQQFTLPRTQRWISGRAAVDSDRSSTAAAAHL